MKDSITKPYIRNELLINPKIQLTLMTFFLVTTISIFIVFLITCNHSLLFIQENMNFNPAAEANYAKLQSSIYTTLSITAFVVFFIFTPLLFIVTHKITGPVWAVKNKLERLSKGENYENIKFRDNDIFHKELEKAYNDYINFRLNKINPDNLK